MARVSRLLQLPERALEPFVRPAPTGRGAMLVVIIMVTLFIAVADYLTDINVALTVFYVVPILLAVAWFGPRAAAWVAVASIALKIGGDFVEGGLRALPGWNWWNAGSTLIVLLLLVWVFGHVLAVHRELEARVADRTRELLSAAEQRRRLEQELVQIGASERSRMGQELHDDICQHLVGTAMAAQVLSSRLEQRQPSLAGEARAIVELIERGVGKTRLLARGLLLTEIDPPQLAERLRELAEEASRPGLACSFRDAGGRVADSTSAAQLYRIAQEGVRNAVRHASASRIDIALGHECEQIVLSIEDDGVGIGESAADAGMGLAVMAQRAGVLGATLAVASRAGGGTRLVCRLPMAELRDAA